MKNLRIAELIFNRPLMITEAKLNVILHVLGPRFNLDLAGLPPRQETAEISDRERSKAGYQARNGLGIIPVMGPLLHRYLASEYPSGGPTTYADIRRAFDLALVDDAVQSIAMEIHSGGGDAMGAFDLADHIYQMRGVKPVTAVVNEEAYSAAYLIASACDRIILPRTGGVGSIGVIATHADFSRAEDQAGITVTHIFSGARKADYTPHAPLSGEALQSLQESVDQTRELFVQTVARNRGLDPGDVRNTEAAIYSGKKAIAAGLADEVMPADKAMQKAATMRRKAQSPSVAGGKATAEIQKGEQRMTKAELKELNPALYAEIFDEGKQAGVSAATAAAVTSEEVVAAARAEGAAAERSRIQAIEALSVPGHEALIASLKYDGTTTAGEAALQVLGAEKQLRVGALSALVAGANPPVATVEAPAEEAAPAADASVEERAAHAWEKDASLKSEFTSLEAYTAYCRKAESGRVRILSKK